MNGIEESKGVCAKEVLYGSAKVISEEAKVTRLERCSPCQEFP